MVSEKEGSVTVSADIEQRKKKIFKFLKEKGNLVVWGLLAIIIAISVFIRTRNIPKLRDITTNTWTLGPDLDPFLFLRWAKYIAEHGKLFLLDKMRYVPLSEICSGDGCIPVNTAGEMNLLSYLIADLHKFLSIFNPNATVTYSAIIFPVIFAVLTGIIFFLFTRKLFYKEDKKVANIVALVSTLFFILVPSLLPRTIAGIPEKESAAFFFLFAAFYCFLEAYTSEKLRKGIIFSVLAGISTALLGLIWGGVTFAFLGIAGAVLFAFLLGKTNEKQFLFYSLWLVSAVIIMSPLSTRYPLSSLITSSSTGLAFMMIFILGVDFLVFKKKIFKLDNKLKKIKLPEQILSILISAILMIIAASIMFGITFVPDTIKDVISHTIEPFDQSRFGVTVAENKQPYFVNDWIGEFGPVVLGVPLYFWLFLVGSVFLFNYMIKPLVKKEKMILTGSYIICLLCLVFSKYSASSILNGESGLSVLIYFGGVIAFAGSFVYVYWKRYKEEKTSIFQEFNFAYLFYFIILTMMIIAARGAVRLVMVLGAVSPIAIGFLVTKTSHMYIKEKGENKKIVMGIIALLILIASVFTAWSYYQSDKNMAENFAPGVYQWQWQKAMAWIRDNTPTTAVFAHWWDYGYWLQSIGERATVLDGGNAVGYWNHLMGRHVLTGTDEATALDFMYAHNVTHLLIDSTDIGKYGAFSSIGSDGNYDHYSWIPTMVRDEAQTQETSNETITVYPVGTVLDEDLIININNKNILLPKRSAAVAAVVMKQNSKEELLQPLIYYIYNSQQYVQPLRYVYMNNKLYDFKTGINGGIFTFPRIDTDSSGRVTIVQNGAAFYLSNRTIDSGIARYYLFGEESEYIKLAHKEENMIIANFKSQGADIGDFMYYQGFQGPIKIWEINYPSNIQLKAEYLSTAYPAEYEKVIEGEY